MAVAGSGGTAGVSLNINGPIGNGVDINSNPIIDSGNITFIADGSTLYLGGGISTSGNVTFEPYSSGALVGVGSSATCGSNCTLKYGNDSFFGAVSANSFIIGDGTNTVAMDINTVATPSSVSATQS